MLCCFVFFIRGYEVFISVYIGFILLRFYKNDIVIVNVIVINIWFLEGVF